MAKAVDVVCVNFNTLNYLSKFYESIKKYNEDIDFSFFVMDNGSNDGSAEFLETLDDVVLERSDNRLHHGECLSYLIREHTTSKYVLTADSDVEFFKSGFIKDMINAMDRFEKVFAVHIEDAKLPMTSMKIEYSEKGIVKDLKLAYAERVSPYLCLWNGRLIRSFLDHLTLGIYIGETNQTYYETAALATKVFRSFGFKDVVFDRKDYVKHYGSVTLLKNQGIDK